MPHTPCLSRAHPRSRGENFACGAAIAKNVGSSPLTRGKLAGTGALTEDLGLIPAHAGKTAPIVVKLRPAPAHPRSRGENSTRSTCAGTDAGSSPLTRGKPRSGPRARRLRRLIPAHAGKTPGAGSRSRAFRAHPRSRGENLMPGCLIAPGVGSSPLTRGKRGVETLLHECGGLIPAHAGKTSQPCSVPAAGAAHPRSRGENVLSPSLRFGGLGSSPLTRGKPWRCSGQTPPVRLIPAHAGKTPSPKSKAARSRAHPRSRGENVSGR